ncbi:hypothetical protein [Coleofasciculus sp. G2-EDA-02]|uniref:hypothetical protein n=1 Tax=Coleofasciculus sp. G2-EDA-02 TaxID=3069529 RepID=UPI0032FDA8D8
MLNYHAIALVRSCALAPILSLVLFNLTSCNTQQSQPPNPKLIAVIEVMQEIETQSKADGGININKLIPLVEHVDRSVKQLPNDTNPKVIKLLQGSAEAYNLAIDYWRCDQESSLSTANYQCKDAVLQDITTQFPLLKKNLDHQLAEQKNPPPHISLLFENSQMFTLLLLQAEVNRIDAQTILAQATTKSAFIPHRSLF